MTGIQMKGSPLPSFEGEITVQSSQATIPYHFQTIFRDPLQPSMVHSLAMHACMTACIVVDVVRKRRPAHTARKYISEECLKKLQTLSYVLQYCKIEGIELTSKLFFVPPEPRLVHGMFISQTKVDVSISLRVGAINAWANLVFERRAGKWLCTTVDIG